MAAPATVADFLALVRQSKLLDGPALDRELQRFQEAGGVPERPDDLARRWIERGVLTPFQADRLLQGRWRGLFVGPYRVLEQIGEGGMGCVYLCEQTASRRRVAVKVLPLARARNPATLERFHRETRATGVLDHPNLIRACDAGQDREVHWLALEYVDGASLGEIVRRHGPLSLPRAAHYLRQAATGLQHAYDAGLVHRDIKPSNLMLDRGGTVKLLDLGLARFFGDSTDNLTRKYGEGALGTADYISPEQADDSHTVDIRADIYSLGATAYFLLTGRPPFDEGTLAQKLIWHQLRDPQPIRDTRPELPTEFVAIVEKMMAKACADRYQTPAEVVAALECWTQTPIPPPPEHEMPRPTGAPPTGGDGAITPLASARSQPTDLPPQAPPRRSPIFLVLTLVGVALLAAAGWWLFLRPR
ncbi:MAG: protein kinase [Planctomycetia bacterium]|nr:protein kinase [Planctomycetia bacterium]